ncbi:MAG: response regulator [Nitrospiraceae bacterium]
MVQHARDGMEAQGLVDMHDHLDLILLDINLPFINGLDVLNHIRKNPR